MTGGTVDSIEKLCNEMETVNRFCYLGDRLKCSGGCKAAVTARVRNVESDCLEIDFF